MEPTTHGRPSRTVLLDVGIAMAAGGLTAFAMFVATEPDARPPDAIAYGIAVLVGVFALVGRRRPVISIVGTSAVLLVYYNLDYAGFSPALPLAVAIYAAAVAGHVTTVGAFVGLFLVAEFSVRFVRDGESPLLLLGQSAEQGGLMLAVFLLGNTVRNHRRWAARAETEREAIASRRMADERLRVARELHDVLAHTVTAMTVQASAAEDLLDRSPEAARRSLRDIRTAGRDAMAELKATIGALRAPEQTGDLGPPRGVDAVPGLLDRARATGLRVDCTIDPASRDWPQSIQATAYRLIQEALTNVVRHAGAAEVVVSIRERARGLVVEVVDDGCGAPPGAARRGHGLVGMRERVGILGGALWTGSGADGGFHVRAELPAAAEPVARAVGRAT